MSGANYEYCPVCDQKALYVGEDDTDDIVVLHAACREQERAQSVQAAVTRITEVITAEGKRLTDAAILRMVGDSLEDNDMVTQVLRGSTIGNLARRLPDLLKSAAMTTEAPAGT